MTPGIRLANAGDADEVAVIYAPVVERTAISFETTPPTAEEMARRIGDAIPRLPWLVFEHDGRVVGYASASPHASRPAYRWTVDVSVYVHERWRRRRVGRGLYESLFDVLRLQGFYAAVAVIALPNRASVGLHESLGFEPVGTYRDVGYKRGEWHDVGHWQLSLQPLVESPDPPTPLEELERDALFEEAMAAGEAVVQI